VVVVEAISVFKPEQFFWRIWMKLLITIMAIIMLVVPSGAISISITSHNQEGMNAIGETMSLSTIGSLAEITVISQDKFAHQVTGSDKGQCSFGVSYSATGFGVNSIWFASKNRDTSWQGFMGDGLEKFQVTSTGM
jgi:hypothetical protein